MKLRLFLALSLTSNVLKKIGFLEENLDKKFKIKFPWIPLKNLHLTLVFLGYLDYEDVLKIDEIFKEIKFEVIPTKIKKIDYGPPGNKRMIWLYVEKNEKLDELKNILEKKLEEKKIKYQKEEREFLPHINLARLKKTSNLPNIKEDLNWSLIFNELVLYQSYLNPEGASYEKLLKLDLDFHP
jgi:2'-5' RNA ligase